MSKSKRGGANKTADRKTRVNANKRTSTRRSNKNSFFVVCIGASAGGLNAVIEVVSQLPANLNAAVFIVLHFSKGALGEILVDRINKGSQLRCAVGTDNEIIKPGHIYVTPPDVHLLVKDKIIIGRGPAENPLYGQFASDLRNDL